MTMPSGRPDAPSSALWRSVIASSPGRGRARLVDSDNRDRHFGPAPVGVGDGRAKKHLVPVSLLVWVDHFGAFQPLGQKADEPVNLAQAALAVDIVAVLRPVAVPGGLGHVFHHFRAEWPAGLPRRASTGSAGCPTDGP